ncbi:hypothetical protein R80B4_02623 [Fibrobacteres bacterium R8-0-B4]
MAGGGGRGRPVSINTPKGWPSMDNAPRPQSQPPSFFDQTAEVYPSSSRSSGSSASEYNEFSQEAEPQYRMGQTVVHKTFGRGKIISVSGIGPDTKLTVLFSDGVRRKLLAKFANLER